MNFNNKITSEMDFSFQMLFFICFLLYRKQLAETAVDNILDNILDEN
ncbi:hypothetical protein [Clostridium psychrophilum]|nr:hypothetical protein [Clostridium psychrophilum]MBU3180728.1 hypothetical protein [Clostridium psychrophilum]